MGVKLLASVMSVGCLIRSKILYLINHWPDVMTFSPDIRVPQRMNPNDFHEPDLSSGPTQVKMSTFAHRLDCSGWSWSLRE